MIYQLPNGRVLHLSVEEYLSLTDTELQAVVMFAFGEESPQQVFHGMPITAGPPEPIDNDIDYTPESEDPELNKTFNQTLPSPDVESSEL